MRISGIQWVVDDLAGMGILFRCKGEAWPHGASAGGAIVHWDNFSFKSAHNNTPERDSVHTSRHGTINATRRDQR